MKQGFKFWRLIFALFVVVVIIETVAFSVAFFVMPGTPILAFPSITGLPAKYLFALIFGGFSKDFFIGYFTYYAYSQWKKLKPKPEESC